MKKVCSTCGESKNASPSKSSQFSWRKDRNRYDYDCKTCRNTKKRVRENKRLRVDTEEQEAMERDRYGFLAEAIIYQAIKDKANEFFETRWYEELRDTANIEEDNVLRCRKHVGA